LKFMVDCGTSPVLQWYPMTQLLLALTTPPRFTVESLIVHEGIQTAVATIQSIYGTGEPPLPPLFLHGPPGTGKTHILNAVASVLDSRFAEQGCKIKFISATGEPPRFPDLEALVSDTRDHAQDLLGVIIDDAHLANEEDSAHLWSLSNKLTRSGAPLILAAGIPPEEIFPDNAHLRSRIVSGLVLGLEPPEDQIRMLIVDKMARDKNVRISHEVCAYLVSRKSRNVKELERLLDILDRASLELKRRITIPLAKVLEREGLL
jgi:chromosomal replication initiation ATPase DnaA